MMRFASAVALSALLLPSFPVAAARRHRHAGHGKRVAHVRGKRHHRGRAVAAERTVAVYNRDGLPNIQAEAAVVVDLGTHRELYQKHADDVRPIASISKLMAMMVVLDHQLDLAGVTQITKTDHDLALRGARSRLPQGMQFTNRDLLHAALIASDNRAVLALGRAVGLDADHFAAEMTRKARDLGLRHTSFGDPTGLDDRNRSTPRELARMLEAALKYPLISEVTRKAKYVASPVGKPNWRIEYNNTDLIARGGRYEVLGGKTGYTDPAGYCLAIAARLDGAREVAMVFLGDHQKLTRFGDFSRAAQWVCEKKPAATDGGERQAAAPLPAPPAAPAPAANEATVVPTPAN